MALEQRVVLLERERVDRAHEPQLAVEVAGAPGERGAVGHLGRGRVERDRRLDVVVGAQPLDRGLEPQAGLGLVDLAPLQQLADLEQLLLGAGTRGAELLELIARGGGPLGLGPPGGAPAVQHLVDALGELAEAAADRGVPEPALLERDPVLLGFGASLRIAGEPVVDLGESVLEHLAPFGELRGAQLQVAALRRPRSWRARRARAAPARATRTATAPRPRRPPVMRVHARARMGRLGAERRDRPCARCSTVRGRRREARACAHRRDGSGGSRLPTRRRRRGTRCAGRSRPSRASSSPRSSTTRTSPAPSGSARSS